MSKSDPENSANRRHPYSAAFKRFIVDGWAEDATLPPPLPAAKWTPARREAAVAAFPGATLVVPAGPLKVRSNDTDYRFRPHTAFAWLAGLGTDREPDSVLVLAPAPILFYRPRAPRTDEEFYASARYGEMWVGRRDSLAEMGARVGIECRDLRDLPEFLAGRDQLLVVRDADPAVTQLVDEARGGADEAADAKLAEQLSEFRLIKDEFEIEQMREACAATKVGFEAVAHDLPVAVARGRGERWVEGIFGLHARHLGNAVGYDTISASGDHANALHWIRNDGDLHDGDLILLDAGVELDTLYTADITRTLPVSGRFTPAQRRVYQAVLAAQSAGIAACRPGAKFIDVHNAAIAVLADFFEELGLLPGTAAESLAPDGGYHRRWMVHGTSHHLGMDVHDCAQARSEVYRHGTLAQGMVITVEPGVYFKHDDLLVPAEYRGIGIRIEDDVLITADGCENLSAALPRDPDDVEAWLASCQAAPAPGAPA
ncbi:MAG: Xaa-Pro aminopeptidase [Arachnia propionica]|nr:MAG: Xaa-Pro aminopeptidase [Arachnia propionica]